jgi:quinol monooxygenase YgiN
MSELTVIAKAIAKEGHESELEQALRASVAPTHDEEGNLHFSLHRAADNPATIIAIERWASKDAWDAHFQTPHIASLLEQTQEIMAAAPEIDVYEYLPEGSSAKGAL